MSANVSDRLLILVSLSIKDVLNQKKKYKQIQPSNYMLSENRVASYCSRCFESVAAKFKSLNVCFGGLNSINDYFFVTKIQIDKLKFYTRL